ncbi:MAG: HAD family phosphatase [Pseudomonadota bacterium]
MFEGTGEAKALSHFSMICCREDVKRKKPDPEVFVLALKQLGVEADNCIVIEDSEAGLKAALRAEIDTVYITPSLFTQHHCFDGASEVAEDATALLPIISQVLKSKARTTTTPN